MAKTKSEEQKKQKTGFFRCSGCSQSFPSEEQLREHQVDCLIDEFEKQD
jgi:ribosomal protein S26